MEPVMAAIVSTKIKTLQPQGTRLWVQFLSPRLWHTLLLPQAAVPCYQETITTIFIL